MTQEPYYKNGQCYWNGELTSTYIGVTYEVSEPKVKTWWYANLVGTRRQGIQITSGKETWIIDNEHGDGFYKITIGQGSPQCGHKSIDNPLNVQEIQYSEINKLLRIDLMKAEEDVYQKWLEENHPETFKMTQSLKSIINKSRQ